MAGKNDSDFRRSVDDKVMQYEAAMAVLAEVRDALAANDEDLIGKIAETARGSYTETNPENPENSLDPENPCDWVRANLNAKYMAEISNPSIPTPNLLHEYSRRQTEELVLLEGELVELAMLAPESDEGLQEKIAGYRDEFARLRAELNDVFLTKAQEESDRYRAELRRGARRDRRIALAVAVSAAALVGAILYGTIRYVNNSDNESNVPAEGVAPAQIEDLGGK